MARRNDTATVGATGAYFACAELSRRGWAASMTIGNMPRTDIVAQHIEREITIAVQSKTCRSGDIQVGAKAEHPTVDGTREWYVCSVLKSEGELPDFYVIPRNVVAAFVFVGHRNWLSGSKKDGSPRKDAGMRTFKRREMLWYKDRWDLLFEPPDQVPYYVPEWFYRAVGEFGLPVGHPFSGIGVRRPEDYDEQVSGLDVNGRTQ